MSTTKYFTKTFRLLKSINFRNKKEKENDSKNELIHPRFEISKNDVLAQKIVTNSLLFLMYSQENEALFI
ncbi:hypothetical protein EKM05_10135 [Flavobacterium sp. GSP27]|uniref:Uncharacterized protein n=1 Tax=Flavobacterium bomense TaxID=2497483 RepID=A0A432CJ72_9FLAO|nr:MULTISPECIES: hypothetical protein [Flavobacterium]RTY93527.1 hypothetical protein EKL32_15685 [Flavobacterium sp. GSN2]RTY65880.1 hypothetical protein EKL95_12450 [Flavobacterium sp. LB2P53]RTY82813.1 hypothetical protein EKL99_08950 [Flavobacterium sp. ZB4P23]RTY89734.1 hypothetical protein EKM01_13165 [Flavobacterium sp. RSP46]RTZ02399.1 hypothetical protein EKL98_13545 [Flavobacterium bomense]